MTKYSDGFGKEFDGNSILLQIKGKKYVLYYLFLIIIIFYFYIYILYNYSKCHTKINRLFSAKIIY